MKVTKEEAQRFADLHQGLPEFEKYSKTELEAIAHDLIEYYLNILKIYQRLKPKEIQLDVVHD